MTTNIEISGKEFARLLKERKAFREELAVQGRMEGISWAQAASYSKLIEMYRGFDERYESDLGYSGALMVSDPVFGDYWRGVFVRNPVVARAANIGIDDSDIMEEEADCFIQSWLIAVEDFLVQLQRKIAEYEDRVSHEQSERLAAGL